MSSIIVIGVLEYRDKDSSYVNHILGKLKEDFKNGLTIKDDSTIAVAGDLVDGVNKSLEGTGCSFVIFHTVQTESEPTISIPFNYCYPADARYTE